MQLPVDIHGVKHYMIVTGLVYTHKSEDFDCFFAAGQKLEVTSIQLFQV